MENNPLAAALSSFFPDVDTDYECLRMIAGDMNGEGSLDAFVAILRTAISRSTPSPLDYNRQKQLTQRYYVPSYKIAPNYGYPKSTTLRLGKTYAAKMPSGPMNYEQIRANVESVVRGTRTSYEEYLRGEAIRSTDNQRGSAINTATAIRYMVRHLSKALDMMEEVTAYYTSKGYVLDTYYNRWINAKHPFVSSEVTMSPQTFAALIDPVVLAEGEEMAQFLFNSVNVSEEGWDQGNSKDMISLISKYGKIHTDFPSTFDTKVYSSDLEGEGEEADWVQERNKRFNQSFLARKGWTKKSVADAVRQYLNGTGGVTPTLDLITGSERHNAVPLIGWRVEEYNPASKESRLIFDKNGEDYTNIYRLPMSYYALIFRRIFRTDLYHVAKGTYKQLLCGKITSADLLKHTLFGAQASQLPDGLTQDQLMEAAKDMAVQGLGSTEGFKTYLTLTAGTEEAIVQAYESSDKGQLTNAVQPQPETVHVSDVPGSTRQVPQPLKEFLLASTYKEEDIMKNFNSDADWNLKKMYEAALRYRMRLEINKAGFDAPALKGKDTDTVRQYRDAAIVRRHVLNIIGEMFPEQLATYSSFETTQIIQNLTAYAQTLYNAMAQPGANVDQFSTFYLKLRDKLNESVKGEEYPSWESLDGDSIPPLPKQTVNPHTWLDAKLAASRPDIIYGALALGGYPAETIQQLNQFVQTNWLSNKDAVVNQIRTMLDGVLNAANKDQVLKYIET